MLTIHNLDICYGNSKHRNHAVADFNLHVNTGEIMALVGPTGCGKSSVLRAVAGLRKPDAGEIIIEGLCTSSKRFVPPEKRRTGMVFQDFALFPHLDVEANIAFRVKDRSEVEHWIEVLGLEGFRHAKPETLSGGQKQRVALARSLAHRPKLLLLDEPLSNLDAALKIELREAIRAAILRAGVTAIWVTHDQNEAMAAGDRIAVMNRGSLEQVATPECCYEAPASRFVAEFFGEGRFIRARRCLDCGLTSLGEHVLASIPASAWGEEAQPPAEQTVDLLLRPHDITLSADEAHSNAVVESHRYEGETRHYCLRLDSGEHIEARLLHEFSFEPGSRVRASVAADHPLVAFPVKPQLVND